VDLALIIYAPADVGYLCFTRYLTLPGIAGFILSIGMAVDTNVNFERTREESRQLCIVL